MVQDNVPRYIASLEQSLISNDLKTFQAHVSAKEFDAADEAFGEFVNKYLAAIRDTPSQAGYITRGLPHRTPFAACRFLHRATYRRRIATCGQASISRAGVTMTRDRRSGSLVTTKEMPHE